MIRHQLTVLWLLFALPLSACHKGDSGSSTETRSVDAPARPPAPKAEVSTVEKIAAKVGLADGLPDLESVIDKPFPEGATEEQVCEAIENTKEKDLWVRLGHMIPMHVFGSIFVLEAPGQTSKQIREFIRDKHYGFDSRTAFCKDTLALVYVRSLPDDYVKHGHREGQVVLAQQLNDDLKVKVRESFAFPDNQERLRDYCRADADLCEALVKLDEANKGRGMCSSAIGLLGLYEGDKLYAEMMQRCSRLKRVDVACAWHAAATAQQEQCREVLREKLEL